MCGKGSLVKRLSLWQVVPSPGQFSWESWILGFCDISVTYGQVSPVEPKSKLLFLRGMLGSWILTRNGFSGQCSFCSMSNRIFYFYQTVKETLWGRWPAKFTVVELIWEFVLLDTNTFFLGGGKILFGLNVCFTWIFPWELKAFCMVTLSRNIWKWESLGNSYGHKPNKNEISRMQPGFQTNFTFYNFDDEGDREVTFFVCLLLARHYNPIKYIISSFYQRGNYNSERLSHLPKAAQLMSCRGRMKPEPSWLDHAALWF